VRVQNFPDPSRFKVSDEVIVVDPESEHFRKSGRILAWPDNDLIVVDDGRCYVKLTDESEVCFHIGMEGKPAAQIRLAQKDDGTFAVISVDGKQWEVRGVPDANLNVGESVKIKADSKAIVSKGYELNAGPICHVNAVTEAGIEVSHKGENQLIYNPKNLVLEPGDRVAVDPSMFSVIKKLERESRDRYTLMTDMGVSWDDVGGLDSAKQEMRDALELPFQNPNLFKFYGIEPLRGVLLYGPPGCGKTLLARAAASSIAEIHGKTNSGYMYIKSPELLDKWVGNTERNIRDIFEDCRRHYREFGYKATLVFDEADAIMAQRGVRRSSDITDTIVPMFLGEMDGGNPKQTQENPFVVLLTNRADSLDPAITRPGRISRHIKIDRPTEMTAIDILQIHTKNLPFKDPKNKMAILAITTSDLYSKSRLLYRLNNEHDFTLGDCVNGAMLQNIAEIARMNALHRDLENRTESGVIVEDFREAVTKVHRQQRGVNHSFDLEDFCERIGIQSSSTKVERCFGSA
jgi:proteasome-associated ATPase